MSDSIILPAKLKQDLAAKHANAEVAKAIYESAANAALLALNVDAVANDVRLDLDSGVVTVSPKPAEQKESA